MNHFWQMIPMLAGHEPGILWLCQYCQRRNALAIPSCAGCGAPRPDTKPPTGILLLNSITSEQWKAATAQHRAELMEGGEVVPLQG